MIEAASRPLTMRHQLAGQSRPATTHNRVAAPLDISCGSHHHPKRSIPVVLTTDPVRSNIIGIVISFAETKQAILAARDAAVARTKGPDPSVVDAIAAASDLTAALDAAGPLIDRCRNRYGFALMQEGLPIDPGTLARVLFEITHGLTMLDEDMRAPRTYPTYGLYLGCAELAWFDDGYGDDTGLAVPDTVTAEALAAFVRPRLAVSRVRSKD